jgi:hypothetical protein
MSPKRTTRKERERERKKERNPEANAHRGRREKKEIFKRKEVSYTIIGDQTLRAK